MRLCFREIVSCFFCFYIFLLPLLVQPCQSKTCCIKRICCGGEPAGGLTSLKHKKPLLSRLMKWICCDRLPDTTSQVQSVNMASSTATSHGVSSSSSSGSTLSCSVMLSESAPVSTTLSATASIIGNSQQGVATVSAAPIASAVVSAEVSVMKPGVELFDHYTQIAVQRDEEDFCGKVERDVIERFQKAAKGGDALALFNLGVCYEQGLGGLAKDEKRAVAYYVEAMYRASGRAQCNLGYCYAHGLGVPKDLEKASFLYWKSACEDDVLARFNLGVCAEFCLGTSQVLASAQNLKMAQYCYGLAAEHGLKSARQRLALVKEKLSGDNSAS